MQCTPQEIEEKRRQARERLSKKNLISNINTSNSNLIKFGGNSNLNQSPSRSVFSAKPSTSVFHSHFSPQNKAIKSPSRNVNNFNSKPYDKPKQAVPFYGRNNVITGICALVAEDRFVVELSGYCAPAIDVFKTIPSRLYNPKTKHWDFHIKDYELLQNKLTLLQPDVVVGKLPVYVVNCCKIVKPDYSSIDFSHIDRELLTALMPFQEQGVCFGIDKQGRCLIADEMGLGKTFQALAVANYYKNDWPVLISTTASMKNVWEETIHKYIPSVSVMHTQYMISGKDYIGDAKILIVSHDMMTRSLDKLLNRKFGIFIVDESHILKNFKAKCTRAATELAKQANRVILLSGTPALSRPSELYTQLALLDEKFFGNFFEYSKRYCDAKSTQFGWDSTGKSNLQELEIILAKRFMIRRTKDDVLKSLPNKEQEIVTLDVNLNQLSDVDRKSLNALAANYNRQKKGGEKHAALLTFFAETAKIKIPSVCSYILQILEGGQKFLVFAHHQKMLDALEQVLFKKNKKFIRIDGHTSTDQRKFFVDKFQVDDSYVCAILSITAANAGITLTAAKLVLFAELHWNPSILSQAESRAHRIGQEGVVIVRYLLAPGTADDSIWPMLQKKQKILKEAGLFKESFDNVPITIQNLSNKEPLAECLHSNLTSANTLDITSYFISPSKSCDNEQEHRNKDNCVRDINKSISDSCLNLDFFNDDFDFKSPSKSCDNAKMHINKENGTKNLNETLIDAFFQDEFDFKLPTEDSVIRSDKNVNQNFASVSGTRMDLFNDDFDFKSPSKENLARNLNKSRSESFGSAELDFFNDDFDEVLSNVELNI